MDGLPTDGIRMIKGSAHLCGHDVPVDLARRLPGETVISYCGGGDDVGPQYHAPHALSGPRTRSAEAMRPANNTGLEVTFVDNEGDAFC